MNTLDLIATIRQQLTETFIDSPETDDDVLDSISTMFSDQDILDRINDATSLVARNVKACHIPNLVVEQTGTGILALPSNFVRLLHGSVRVLGKVAVYRDQPVVKRLVRSGRVATAEYPFYALQNRRVTAHPYQPFRVKYIVSPARKTLGQDLDVDHRFEPYVVYTALKSLYETKNMAGLVERYKAMMDFALFPFVKGFSYSRVSDVETEVEP